VLYFFDTSALAKRYHFELGSPTVIGLFDDPTNQVVICSLSLTETLAVLARRRRRAELSDDAFDLSGADAVILACALDLLPDSPIFVCADTRSGLLRAAEARGLSTLNPLSPAR
jgi:predicted nucleic acid-binding protein